VADRPVGVGAGPPAGGSSDTEVGAGVGVGGGSVGTMFSVGSADGAIRPGAPAGVRAPSSFATR
jgi:hypothetical protein